MTMTKVVRRAMWLARFDVEPLLSAILRHGTWLCFMLALGSVILEWGGTGGAAFGDRMHAKSLPALLVTNMRRVSSLVSWPRLLLDFSVAALLLTPYLRVLISLLYFAWVERNRRYTLLTVFVFALLTIVVLTNVV